MLSRQLRFASPSIVGLFSIPFIIGILLTDLYVPWFMSRASGPRWMTIAVMVPLFFIYSDKAFVPDFSKKIIVLFGIFVGYSALSTFWAISVYDAVERNFQLYLAVLCIIFGVYITSKSWDFLAAGLGVGMWVNFIVGSFQYYEPLSWLPQHTKFSAFFMNGNYLSEAAVVITFFIMASLLNYRQKLFLVLPCLGCAVMGGSRGAVISLIVTLLVMGIRGSKRKVLYLTILLPVATSIATWYVLENKSDPYVLLPRWAMYANTFVSWDWFGRGAGSYLSGYATISNAYVQSPPSVFGFATRPASAHNDILTMLFEYGVVGVGIFSLFLGVLLKSAIKYKHFYIVLAVLLLGLTNFPLYNPTPLFLFFVTCGRIISADYFLALASGTRRV